MSEVSALISSLKDEDPRAVEESLVALLNLTATEDRQVSTSELESITKIVLEGKTEYIQTLGVWLLAHLAINEKACQDISNIPNLLPHVIQLCSSPLKDTVDKSVLLLNNLTVHKSILPLLRDNDIILTICEILESWESDSAIVSKVLKPLRNLFLGDEENQKDFCLNHGVKKLLPILSSSDEELQEEALKVFISLALFDDLIRKIIVASGALPHIIRLFSSTNLLIQEHSLKAFVALLHTESNFLHITTNEGTLQYALPLVDNILAIHGDKPTVVDPQTMKVELLTIVVLNTLSQNEDFLPVFAYTGLAVGLSNLLKSCKNETRIIETTCKLILNLVIDADLKMELKLYGVKQILETLLEENQTLSSIINEIIEVFDDDSRRTSTSSMTSEEEEETEEQKRVRDEQDRLRKEHDQLKREMELFKFEQQRFMDEQQKRLEEERRIFEEEKKKFYQQQQQQQNEQIEEKQKKVLDDKEKKLQEEISKKEEEIKKTEKKGEFEKKKKMNATLRKIRTKKKKELAVSTEEEATKKAEFVRRKKIAEEILSTEKSYFESLQVCVKVYLENLRGTTKPLISPEEMKDIFGVIDLITKIHQKLLNGLKKKIESFSEDTQIGEHFSQFFNEPSTLKVYTDYIQHFDVAMARLADCSTKYPKFKEFLEKCRTTPEVGDRDLLSFLIMPVQRIPRYILLLEDLLKHTPEDHVDFQPLKSALNVMKDIATTINETKRAVENTKKLISIQDSFANTLPENIVEPTRIFMREGNFVQIKKKGSKYRYLFLFDDILIVSNQKKKKYVFKTKIPLLEINKLLDLEDSKTLKNAFKIIWTKKTGTTEMTFSSSNLKEKEQFFEDLQQLSANQKKSRISLMNISLLAKEKKKTSSIPTPLAEENQSDASFTIAANSIQEKLLSGGFEKQIPSYEEISRLFAIVKSSTDGDKLKTKVRDTALQVLFENAFPEEKVKGLFSQCQGEKILGIAADSKGFFKNFRHAPLSPSDFKQIGSSLWGRSSHRIFPGVLKNKQVCLDIFYVEHPDFDYVEFKRRLFISSVLSHETLWKCYGAFVPEGGNPIVVMEYDGTNGVTVADLLFVKKRKLFMKAVWNLVFSIASAMAYVHENGVVHRAIRNENIMVIEKDLSCPKLINFASMETTLDLLKQKDKPSVAFIAPEVLATQKYQMKSDVFSFGMVMWEMISRTPPFSPTIGKNIPQILASGERPPIPDFCPKEFASIIELCWQPDPSKRPSFMDLISKIKQNMSSKF